MRKKIIYQKDEELGPWGCKYLEERPKIGHNRRALFKCGFCNNCFESEISNIKTENKKVVVVKVVMVKKFIFQTPI